MTRSEMAFLMGVFMLYMAVAHNAPTHFAWMGGVLSMLGYFTAPAMRIHFNAALQQQLSSSADK